MRSREGEGKLTKPAKDTKEVAAGSTVVEPFFLSAFHSSVVRCHRVRSPLAASPCQAQRQKHRGGRGEVRRQEISLLGRMSLTRTSSHGAAARPWHP